MLLFWSVKLHTEHNYLCNNLFNIFFQFHQHLFYSTHSCVTSVYTIGNSKFALTVGLTLLCVAIGVVDIQQAVQTQAHWLYSY